MLYNMHMQWNIFWSLVIRGCSFIAYCFDLVSILRYQSLTLYRSLHFSLGWTVEEVLRCERLHKTPFQNEQWRGPVFHDMYNCFCDSWAIFTVSWHYLHQLVCATNSRHVFIDILVLRYSWSLPLLTLNFYQQRHLRGQKFAVQMN